ncbi:hypothetical protein B0H19DRAFT_1078973 [Mycena capillaripes]|nr:hypothetical protein B0H19DRAFT_1078973 [Mycena capillaripes]
MPLTIDDPENLIFSRHRGSQPRPSSLTHPRTRRAHRISRGRTQEPAPLESSVLTCGTELVSLVPNLSDSTPYGSSQKWVVPILPLPLDDSPPSQMPKASTVCGATIHTRASPRGPKTWLGCADALGPTVIPLPAEYFTDDQKCHLAGGPRTKSCGCIMVGVGCCLCGNTLGVHRTLCAAHFSILKASHRSSYTFLAESVSPSLPRRRKAVIIGRNEAQALADDAGNPNNWSGELTETARPPSPTHSDLVEMGIREEARIQAEENEARIQATFAHGSGAGYRRLRSHHSSWNDHEQPAGSVIIPPGLAIHTRMAGAISEMEMAWTLQNSPSQNNRYVM